MSKRRCLSTIILSAIIFFFFALQTLRRFGGPRFHRAANSASGCGGGGIPTEDLLLAPGTGLLPPSSAAAPLLIVLLVHLFREAHALAVLRTWAQPRCLRLLRDGDFGGGDGGADAPAGWLLLQPFTFDASPHLNVLRDTLPAQHHAALPLNFSATMRTEEALRRAHARHPAALWVFKGDDDTCVHSARLVRSLLARNASVPALVGHVAPLIFGAYRFVSGGAGYALSAPALEGLVPRLTECNGEASGFRYSTAEDVMITKCARDFFGDGVMLDDAGFNWGRPEEMLAMGVYDEAHLHAAAITHHYIDPLRVVALMDPLYPRQLLQVWPFASPPPPPATWLGPLPWEHGPQQQLSVCSPNPPARVLARVEECRREAVLAGFEYRLIPATLAPNLGAPQLLPFLQPPAVEQLALLRALYLEGGVAVPLSASCEGLRALLGALLEVAEAEGGRRAAVDVVASPRRGLAVAMALSKDQPPRAWAAPQYHHGVFRLLAAQSLNISEALQEARGGTVACDHTAAGVSIRSQRSAALLHGGSHAPLRLATAYNLPFARLWEGDVYLARGA